MGTISESLADGLKHHRTGELDQAGELYAKVLRIDPRQPDALHLLGMIDYQQGRHHRAVERIGRAIAVNPNVSSYYSNLGVVYGALGELDKAVSNCRHAVEISVNYAEAHNNLANSLAAQGKHDEAVANFRHALDIEPQNATVWNNLGRALEKQRKADEAEACYRKAVQLKPTFADALVNLARSLEKHNRVEEAAAIAAECRRIDPHQPGAILVVAACQRRRGQHPAAIDALEKLRRRPDLNAAATMNLHFELGRCYDGTGQTTKAFDCFVTANRFAAQESAEEIADLRPDSLRSIDILERVLTEQFVESWSPPVPLEGEAPPAFLIGFPRSGTTLLDVILDSHPQIQTVEEKPMVVEMRNQLASSSRGYPLALADLTPAIVRSLRATYFGELDRHVQRRPGNLLVDKFPTNGVDAGLIQRVFPGARFIVIARHPCDVCLSCFMQNFVLNGATSNFFTLEDTARFYDKLMRLWRRYVELLPLDHHLLKYEDLVDDFEGETRRVLQFLGMEWDDALNSYVQRARQRSNGWISTASYHQVVEPIHKRACGRWRRYAAQLAPVMDVLEPHIEFLGYDS